MGHIVLGRYLNESTDAVTVHASTPLPVAEVNRLVPLQYDHISTTYKAGTDLIETVTYKTGGASGTTQAVLTLTYDSYDRISTVTRTSP